MNREKIEQIALLLLGIVCGGILLVVFLRYILPVILPFIIAWLVAFTVREPAKKLNAITHIPSKVLRPALAILFTLLVFSVVGILVWQLASFLWRFASDVSESGALYMILDTLANPSLPLPDGINAEGLGQSIRDGIEKLLSSVISTLGNLIADIAAFVPKSFLFVIITVISLVYFSVDLERINSVIKRLLPQKIGRVVSDTRRRLFTVIGKYVKSYLQIMLIIFTIVLIGFLIIGVENAVGVAILVSLVDLLPILGIGTVMIPWAIFSLAIGEHVRAVGLLVLFVVAVVIRELAEPKIVGENLGIHPLITLIAIYVGYALFGFIGLILFPVIAVLICALFDKDNSPEV